MSDDKTKESKIRLYFFICLASVGIVVVVASVNALTLVQSVVPAPCEIILNGNYAIPDGVITKGYSIERFDNGTESGKSCYYIKNAGILEREFYGWSAYDWRDHNINQLWWKMSKIKDEKDCNVS